MVGGADGLGNQENPVGFLLGQTCFVCGFVCVFNAWLLFFRCGQRLRRISINCFVGWLVGWLVGRLVGWLVGWSVGWLVCRSHTNVCVNISYTIGQTDTKLGVRVDIDKTYLLV